MPAPLSEAVSVLAAHFIAGITSPIWLWMQDTLCDFHHFRKPQPHWQDDLESPGPLSDSKPKQWHLMGMSFPPEAHPESSGPA